MTTVGDLGTDVGEDECIQQYSFFLPLEHCAGVAWPFVPLALSQSVEGFIVLHRPHKLSLFVPLSSLCISHLDFYIYLTRWHENTFFNLVWPRLDGFHHGTFLTKDEKETPVC